jgi:hypothetical protein
MAHAAWFAATPKSQVETTRAADAFAAWLASAVEAA